MPFFVLKEFRMAELLVDETRIGIGERYFALYVDRPKGNGSSIVAELRMDLEGPVTLEVLRAKSLSGFELPALEMAHKAMERADEQGVEHILLIDPYGLLPLAKVNRYDR
jgi:hypothetical protein